MLNAACDVENSTVPGDDMRDGQRIEPSDVIVVSVKTDADRRADTWFL